jgi:hypothetical protein
VVTRRDAPNEGNIPSLRSEGVAEAGASATVVQKPSKDTLASLKDDPKEEGTLSLVADDILTDARARTEILPGLLPPMHEAPFERADTSILLAPPPPVIGAPSVPDAPAPVAPAAVEAARSSSPPASDSGNLPLIIVSVVLFLIAAAIVVGSLSHG